MKRFIISEDERKHIKVLYENFTKDCSEKDKKKYDNLVNNVYPGLLKNAIKWWEEWLRNPITKEKFIIHNPEEKNPDEVFSNYFKILSEIELLPYGPCTSNPNKEFLYDVAYVDTIDLPKQIIHVNTRYNLEPQIISDTFIHEIQHLLFNSYPLNPEYKIEDCFTINDIQSGGDYKKNSSVFQSAKNIFTKKSAQLDNTSKIPQKEINETLKRISSDIGIPIESAKKLYYAINRINKESADYIGNPTELYSRFYTIRNKLNIKPGENVTKEMLKPYFTNIINSKNIYDFLIDSESNQYDFNHLITYWGYTGYGDLTNILNELNRLAMKQNNKNNNIA